MNYNQLPIDPAALMKSILANSSIAAIFILDEKGTILTTSPGALKTFGYSEEYIVGKNFSILFTRQDKNKNNPENELKSVVETGSQLDVNFILHRDGRQLWCLGESILAKDEKGNNFITKIVFEIDEQRRLKENLTRTNKDLNNFVYTASHDLRAPINNIEALVETLKGDPECTAKSSFQLSLIMESIIKFKNMLQDLSEIGKIQEESKNDVTEITFKEITEDVIHNLKREIKESGAVIKYDFADAARIKFSRKNMRSILHNLISNSIKFRTPGSKPEVNITSETAGDAMILLKVSDNGIGIKEEDKQKVFSMYKRLNSNIEGTGVGLALVARIVDNNGGKIEIDSEVKKGTTFNIYLMKEPHSI
jgi:PAS domain S-box-containing protein